MDLNLLKNTLGMAMSTIATEHFYSAGLSSPWSVAKFAESPQDQKEVWHYFGESSKSSLIFGGILSLTMKSIWPLAGAGVTCLYYKSLYNHAMKKASLNQTIKQIGQNGANKTIAEIMATGSIEDIKRLSEYLCGNGNDR